MNLYMDDAESARLSELSQRTESATADLLARLAWSLRQRNTKRACLLATKAEALLRAGSVEGDTAALRGRLGLIRAEAAWLGADFDRAERQLAGAAHCFAALDDRVGQGDVLQLRSFMAFDQGETTLRQSYLAQAAECYRAAGDAGRARLCDAWAALGDSYVGDRAAVERVLAASADDVGTAPVVDGLLGFARAQLLFMEGDYAAATIGFEAAAQRLQDYGLIRQAISATLNAGIALGNLGAYAEQARLVEYALALARPRGWPIALGACLYVLGDAQHSLGRLEPARAAFAEARQILQKLPQSRVYITVTTFLGEISLRLGQVEEARDLLDEAREAAERGGHGSLATRALAGLAACRAKLGAPEEALALLQQSLDEAAGKDLVTERHALARLARLHGEHSLPPPAGMQAPSAEIHYLERLWALQAQNSEWAPDEELLRDMAAAWERAGDCRRALDYERRLTATLASAGARRAEQQIAAIQARQETDTLRREAEHQRRQAEEERGRLAVLERLNAIGQEITASLDPVAILHAVDRHAGTMLDIAAMALWLVQGDALEMTFDYGRGHGLTVERIALDNPDSAIARCARERREILPDAEAAAADQDMPGQETRTTLLAPLAVGPRLLGVIAIQSSTASPYSERARLIFRNICIYAAIALGNAANYQMLSLSHQRLIGAQADLERLANYDMLTGLANRRQLIRAAAVEIARARRSGAALSVLLIDLDHFKRVNDTHGHAAGDAALKVAAETILYELRPSDIASRYGGEEFVILLPETDARGAEAAAERLRAAIEARSVAAEGTDFSMTASIGGAGWDPAESEIEPALRRADACLYAAKAAGRNRVMIGGPCNAAAASLHPSVE